MFGWLPCAGGQKVRAQSTISGKDTKELLDFHFNDREGQNFHIGRKVFRNLKGGNGQLRRKDNASYAAETGHFSTGLH